MRLKSNLLLHGEGGSIRCFYLNYLDKEGMRLTFKVQGPGLEIKEKSLEFNKIDATRWVLTMAEREGISRGVIHKWSWIRSLYI